MDENGDHMVSANEVLSAAKDALILMRAMQQGGGAGAADTGSRAREAQVARGLDALSTYLYRNGEEAAEVWARHAARAAAAHGHEARGEPLLTYGNVAEFFREVSWAERQCHTP